MTIIYSKYCRAARMRSEQPETSNTADVVFGITVLFLALLLVSWVEATVEETDRLAAKASAHQQRADASELAWLSCLNKNVIFVNGQAHLCQLTDLQISQR